MVLVIVKAIFNPKGERAPRCAPRAVMLRKGAFLLALVLSTEGAGKRDLVKGAGNEDAA